MRFLVLVAFVLLGLQLAAGVNPVAICGISGYDVPYLSRIPYWTFSSTFPTFCPGQDVEKCQSFISFCHSLPPDACEGATNTTTVCQKATLTNGSFAYDTIGNLSTELKYPNIGTLQGFSFAWNAVPTKRMQCSSSRKVVATTIDFICDPRAIWSEYAPDISQFVVSAKFEKSKCEYTVLMRYNGACYKSPTINPATCSLDGYPNVTQLGIPSSWKLSLPFTEFGICQQSSASVTSCVIEFSFCRALPLSDYNCYDSVACQEVTYSNSNRTTYSMGNFSPNTKFMPSPKNQLDGFNISLAPGSPTSSCPNGPSTEIVFLCDKAAKWNTGTIPFVDGVIEHFQCKYNIILLWSGACTSATPHKSVNGGWVFFGLLCAVLAVLTLYCVVGVVVQHFVNGKTGIRMIPNYTFWKWSLDVITCYKLRASKGYTMAPTYSNL